jgi:cytoskeletal protein CcmA (bactofilin family)
MRRRAHFVTALLVALLVVPAPASALEEAISDLVLIQVGDVVEGDLLAGGNRVQMSGTVQGDLIATAFEEIRVSGVVEGDLLALAPRVVVDGRVLGSVRVVSAETEVLGQVSDDVLVVGRSLEVEGLVGKDVFAALWDATVSGIVNGNVRLTAVSATVDGGVTGDVEGSIRTLTIPADGRVRGDVVVRGTLDLADPASVDGAARTPEARQLLRVRAVAVLGWLVVVGIWLAAGPIIRSTAPRWLESRLVAARRPSSFLRGLGAFGLLAIAVGIVWGFASLSPPEVAVGLGALALLLGLAGIVLLAAVALVGVVPVTMQVGAALGARRGHPEAHARGALAIFLVALIPWVGSAVLTAMAVHAIGVVVPSARLREEDGDEQRGRGEAGGDEDAPTEDGPVDVAFGPGTEPEPDEGGDGEDDGPE